ncbi:leucine Rich repeat-containing domain protein [Teladorsagia circumcincta]|uniref:Leucine Rich repeat-containing domain protein n=1 Tax=Teladorsagia circumcincta TaxID=45464 RepID=A0A2G9V0U0_TELCI|nr:leucine Rich repeat-containing domain protein [Teladorsagia circumcincta]
MHNAGLRHIQSRFLDGLYIKRLDFSYNQMVEIDDQAFTGMSPIVQELILAHNNLTKIPAVAITPLNTILRLDLSNNSITDISHEDAFPSLPKYLYLTNNQITHLTPHQFASFNQIEMIDLTGNIITEIPDECMARLQQLRQLFLGENHIHTIGKNAFANSSIVILSLINNELTEISEGMLDGMPRLQSVVFKGNKIKFVHHNAFYNTPSVIKIDLSDNEIVDLSPSTFLAQLNLQMIDLRNNKLPRTPYAALNHRVGTVFLQENPLVCTEKIHMLQDGLAVFVADSEDVICGGRSTPLPTSSSESVPTQPPKRLNIRPAGAFQQDSLLLQGRQEPTEVVPHASNTKAERYESSHAETTDDPDTVQPLPVSILDEPQTQNQAIDRGSSTESSSAMTRQYTLPSTVVIMPKASKAVIPQQFSPRSKSPSQKEQTACSCFDNLDGSVIRCSGQEGPMMVEQMKKLHFEIRELTLENANIVEIGPRAFKNLRIRKLVLDKNRIKAIHKDALRGLENVLQELSLAQNKLTEVPSDAIAGMRALSVLNLKCNRIGNLTKSVFQKLDSLIDVNLSCNEVCEVSSDVFDGVRNTLQNLILDSNCLRMFPAGAVKNMEALIALHLKGNKINTIGEGELTNLTSLAMLSLSNNNISFIHPSALQNTPNLRYVYLAGNKIQSLASGTMTQLKQTQVLDLAFNQLSEIGEETFAGLESLQHLNLESNNIQSIASGAFAGIPLLLLWLPNNCLNLITPATFQGALFLRQLSLANNNIKEIQPLSFNHLANLHTVDLANNRIRSLQQGAIQGSDHLTVRLQENPMVCLQDGFHVMNGNQAINLTTEPNNICKTNWHDESDKVCSKATTSPVTLQCCKRNSVAVSALITSTAAPATTSTEEDEPEDEKETEEKDDGDDEVDRQAVSRAHSNEEETTTGTTRSSSTYQTTRAPTRTLQVRERGSSQHLDTFRRNSNLFAAPGHIHEENHEVTNVFMCNMVADWQLKVYQEAMKKKA